MRPSAAGFWKKPRLEAGKARKRSPARARERARVLTTRGMTITPMVLTSLWLEVAVIITIITHAANILRIITIIIIIITVV